jgi:hypothetical protein
MDKSLESKNSLLPQIEEEILMEWPKMDLGKRILSPEILMYLKDSRDFGTPLLSEDEYNELALAIGCKANVIPRKIWTNRLLSCLCMKNVHKRWPTCKQQLAGNQPLCKVLAAQKTIPSDIQSNLFDLKVGEKTLEPAPEIHSGTYPPHFQEDVSGWVWGTLVSTDGPYQKIPRRLHVTLLELATKGIQHFDSGKLCENTICSGQCVSCVDGVLRGSWDKRSEFFGDEPSNHGTPASNYLVPNRIISIYNTFGNSPVSRLATLGNSLNNEI